MADVENPRPTLLLVHGAWHGAWCWEKLQAELAADGWAVRTVELPSASEARAGVFEDAETVRARLREIEGPVVVVGHSYGGIPVTQATADADNVTHLVYLAAYQLDVGESMFGFHGAPIPETTEGVMPVSENARTQFYADVPEPEAEQAVQRLAPQSLRSCCDRVTKAGWRTIPSTYLVCEQDQALPPRDQETMAARADTVHRLASSHSPFLSIPGELAALLAKIAVTGS